MDRHNKVLTKMEPFCFYRPKDLKDGVGDGIYTVLRSLVDGVMIEKVKQGRVNLYISNKQKRLF